MIKNFKHKGLQQYFERDSKKGLDHRDLEKIRRILDRLDSSVMITDMDLPGWCFHELKGDRKGIWSVSVRANWKITFRFIKSDAFDINLEDYH